MAAPRWPVGAAVCPQQQRLEVAGPAVMHPSGQGLPDIGSRHCECLAGKCAGVFTSVPRTGTETVVLAVPALIWHKPLDPSRHTGGHQTYV